MGSDGRLARSTSMISSISTEGQGEVVRLGRLTCSSFSAESRVVAASFHCATLRGRVHLHLETAGMNWSLQRHLLQRRWLSIRRRWHSAGPFCRPERTEKARRRPNSYLTENQRLASGDGRDRMLNTQQSLFFTPKNPPARCPIQTAAGLRTHLLTVQHITVNTHM